MKVTVCKDRRNIILTDKTSILQRWIEHFNQLLDLENDTCSVVENYTEVTDSQQYDIPTKEEIKEIYMALKIIRHQVVIIYSQNAINADGRIW